MMQNKQTTTLMPESYQDHSNGRIGISAVTKQKSSISGRLIRENPEAIEKGLDRESGDSNPCVRLAETSWDHIQSFHLLHEQYVAKDYVRKCRNQIFLRDWNLSERSCTFLAEQGSHLLGTVTAIRDGSPNVGAVGDLPADGLYPNELMELRQQGRRVLEMSCFATSHQSSKSDLALRLLREAMTCSRKVFGVTDWVCTVNPHHVGFYTRMLLFEVIGEARLSKYVNGAPAVLLRLNLQGLSERYARRYGSRKGHRNLFKFFFDPKEDTLRLRKIQAAMKRRANSWKTIRKVLMLMVDSKNENNDS